MGKVSEIMLLKQPKQSALAVEVHTDMNGMSEAIGKNFVKIDSLFKAQGEITTDIPYVEYPDFESLTEHNIKMIIGLKSSRELQGEGDIRSITIPERKIVSCLHRGTYSELAVLYNEMMEWIKNNGYKPSGTSIRTRRRTGDENRNATIMNVYFIMQILPKLQLLLFDSKRK